jgi:hypothetical protein
MSIRLQKNKNFLCLLLDPNTGENQIKALFKSVNDNQILALVEIGHNLLNGSLSISPQGKKKIEENRKLFDKLCSKSNSLDSKARLLSKYWEQVFLCLYNCRKVLLTVLT